MASISQRYAIEEVPQEVFAVRFSADGAVLATGCNDGAVRVYGGQRGGRAPLATLLPTAADGGPQSAHAGLSPASA